MTTDRQRMTQEDWEESEYDHDYAIDGPLVHQYLWSIADVYDIALTNGGYQKLTPEGRTIRDIGDFISDVKEAFIRAGWIAPTREVSTQGDENIRQRIGLMTYTKKES